MINKFRTKVYAASDLSAEEIADVKTIFVDAVPDTSVVDIDLASLGARRLLTVDVTGAAWGKTVITGVAASITLYDETGGLSAAAIVTVRICYI